jgi:hypothetical protein
MLIIVENYETERNSRTKSHPEEGDYIIPNLFDTKPN